MKNKINVLWCAFVLAACGPMGGDSGTGGDGDDGDNGGGETTCTGKTECGSLPTGEIIECNDNQYCVDQILSRCAEGCTSDQNCVEGQTCLKDGDTGVGTCQKLEQEPVDPCVGVTCDAGEVCRQGSCVAAGGGDPCDGVTCGAGEVCRGGMCEATGGGSSCQPSETGEDGCASNAVCLPDDDFTSFACVTYVPCTSDDSCFDGETCVSEPLPGKEPACLEASCVDDSECPANWNCIKTDIQSEGFCDDGTVGAECVDDDDCIDELVCFAPFPGEAGSCSF